jgi:hypothetical protein
MTDLTPEGKIVYLIRQSGSVGKRFRVLRREMAGEFSERHLHRLIEKLIGSGKIVKSSDEDGFSRYYVSTTDVNVSTPDTAIILASLAEIQAKIAEIQASLSGTPLSETPAPTVLPFSENCHVNMLTVNSTLEPTEQTKGIKNSKKRKTQAKVWKNPTEFVGYAFRNKGGGCPLCKIGRHVTGPL